MSALIHAAPRGIVLDPWTPALERYRAVYEAWHSLTTQGVRRLHNVEVVQASLKLETAHGNALVTNPEFEWPVVLDYALYCHRLNRENVVQRMLAEQPPLYALQEATLEAMALSSVHILDVERCDPGVGVQGIDVWTGAELTVMGPPLTQRYQEGDRFIARVVEVEGLLVATDATMPLSDEGLFAVVDALEDCHLDPQDVSRPDDHDTYTQLVYRAGLGDGP